MRRSCRAAISLVLALAGAFLAEAALALSGEITHLSGAVVARRADGQSRILSVRSEVREGDLLLTAENAYARVKWTDGGEVVLRPNTQLRIDAYRYEEGRPQQDNVLFSLIKGGLRSVTGLLARRNPASFRLATPTATVGIRGTHFGALFCANDCAGVPTPAGGAPANGLHLDVSDGVIVAFNPAGSVEVRIGQFGFVATLADRPVLVPPEQGVRVLLPSAVLNQSIQGGTVGKGGDLECRVQ
jgi:hypothetical protein